jgi:hypothetical protein
MKAMINEVDPLLMRDMSVVHLDDAVLCVECENIFYSPAAPARACPSCMCSHSIALKKYLGNKAAAKPVQTSRLILVSDLNFQRERTCANGH